MSELERVNGYFYQGDNMNGEGRSELAVTRKIGLGWKAFNSMSFMLCGKRHTWNIKTNLQDMCEACHDIWLKNLGGKIR